MREAADLRGEDLVGDSNYDPGEARLLRVLCLFLLLLSTTRLPPPRTEEAAGEPIFPRRILHLQLISIIQQYKQTRITTNILLSEAKDTQMVEWRLNECPL